MCTCAEEKTSVPARKVTIQGGAQCTSARAVRCRDFWKPSLCLEGLFLEAPSYTKSSKSKTNFE